MIPKRPYKKTKPSLAQRGKFSEATITEILERDDYQCVVCSAPPVDIHHVRYKSQNGRNVVSNGVSLCRNCHEQAHSSSKLRYELEQRMIDMYGVDFYKDSWDLNE